jgi:hypothetical protein
VGRPGRRRAWPSSSYGRAWARWWAGCHLGSDELLDGAVKGPPGERKRATAGDVRGQGGVSPGEAWGEDAAVGLGEPGGNAPAKTGELVALGEAAWVARRLLRLELHERGPGGWSYVRPGSAGNGANVGSNT